MRPSPGADLGRHAAHRHEASDRNERPKRITAFQAHLLGSAPQRLGQREPQSTLRTSEMPDHGLSPLKVTPNFCSRPGAGLDQSTPWKNGG